MLLSPDGSDALGAGGRVGALAPPVSQAILPTTFCKSQDREQQLVGVADHDPPAGRSRSSVGGAGGLNNHQRLLDDIHSERTSQGEANRHLQWPGEERRRAVCPSVANPSDYR
jgi:hypothetical protein